MKFAITVIAVILAVQATAIPVPEDATLEDPSPVTVGTETSNKNAEINPTADVTNKICKTPEQNPTGEVPQTPAHETDTKIQGDVYVLVQTLIKDILRHVEETKEQGEALKKAIREKLEGIKQKLQAIIEVAKKNIVKDNNNAENPTAEGANVVPQTPEHETNTKIQGDVCVLVQTLIDDILRHVEETKEEGEALKKTIREKLENIKQKLQAIIEVAKKLIEKGKEGIEKIVGEIQGAVAEKVEEGKEIVKEKIDKIEKVKEEVEQKVGEIQEGIEKKVEEIKGAAEDKVGVIKEGIEKKVGEIKGAVAEKVEEGKEIVEEKIEKVKEGVEQKVGVTKAKEVIKDITNSLGNTVGILLKDVTHTTGAAVNGLGKTAESALNGVGDLLRWG